MFTLIRQVFVELIKIRLITIGVTNGNEHLSPYLRRHWYVQCTTVRSRARSRYDTMICIRKGGKRQGGREKLSHPHRHSSGTKNVSWIRAEAPRSIQPVECCAHSDLVDVYLPCWSGVRGGRERRTWHQVSRSSIPADERSRDNFHLFCA